ncbi:MAG: hypothetical protein BRC22_02230 [Parcubacteria group bacterium QH_9_35_7]|nr:MAG: hypothetical protein BRC22_02230 [Parcubacteria group bacterium QH_9_35_7]
MDIKDSEIFVRTKNLIPTKFLLLKMRGGNIFFVADFEADRHRELLDCKHLGEIGEVLGGGMVTIRRKTDLILLAGESGEFGREDRQKTKEILSLHYQNLGWKEVEIDSIE